jgi:hypothetical protein
MRNALRIPAGGFALILIAVVCTADDMHFEPVRYAGAVQTDLTGINNEGVAVGYYEQRLLHGFIYKSGTMTRLEGPLGDGNTRLLTITNNGEILIAQGPNYFIYKDGHSIRITGPPTVTGMNSKRQIVGNSGGQGFYGSPALGALDSTAPVQTSASLKPMVCPGGIPAQAFGINDQGHITGTCGLKGFIFDGHGYKLFVYPGARVTSGLGINNADVVVGTYQAGGGPPLSGMIYDGSKFTPLDLPRAFSSAALGINDGNQIVGSFRIGNDTGGADWGFISSGSPSPPQ